jgi:hypothetical protein
MRAKWITKIYAGIVMISGISVGMLLLGVYLIAVGLMPFVPGLAKLGKVVPVLALMSGVCILIGR